TAMCASACMDDPRCAGQTAGETSCAGPAVQECVTNTDGCLEPELTTCAAGELCDDSRGTAMCAQSCANVLQRLSCADAGNPVMGNTSGGTMDNAEYSCAPTLMYDGNGVSYEFVNDTATTMTVSVTFDSADGDFDLF